MDGGPASLGGRAMKILTIILRQAGEVVNGHLSLSIRTAFHPIVSSLKSTFDKLIITREYLSHVVLAAIIGLLR